MTEKHKGNPARTWTEKELQTLLDMRAAGGTYNEITRAIGGSRTAIAKKCKDMSATVLVKDPGICHVLKGRDANPLPAGHDLTWRCISNRPWPYAQH
jgi:hypothetical protein